MSGLVPLEEEKTSARKQNQVICTTYTSQPTVSDLISAKVMPAPPPPEVRRPNVAYWLLRQLCRCFADYNNSDPSVPIRTIQNTRPLLDEQKPHQAGKKTLVLDLDETLAHSSFDPIPKADVKVNLLLQGRNLSLYVKFRPGAKEFIVRMSELFEIVIFSASTEEYANPVVTLLDEHKVVTKRLFKDSCTLHRGFHVKDLGRLGRNLKDVILIDNSEHSYMFHPTNAILIKSFFDDHTDQELILLMPFLENLAVVQDVRPVETRRSEFEAEYLKRMILVSEKDEEEQPIEPIIPSFHQSAESQKREISILETSELHIPMEPPKVSTMNEEEMSIHQSIQQSSIPQSINKSVLEQPSPLNNRSNWEQPSPLNYKSQNDPPSSSYNVSNKDIVYPEQKDEIKSNRSIQHNSARNSPKAGQNEQPPRGWRPIISKSDRYVVDSIEVAEHQRLRVSQTQPDRSIAYQQESIPVDLIQELKREENASHMAAPHNVKRSNSRSISNHPVTPVITTPVPELAKDLKPDPNEATPATPDVIGLVFRQ